VSDTHADISHEVNDVLAKLECDERLKDLPNSDKLDDPVMAPFP
jgi:hypothetical protein